MPLCSLAVALRLHARAVGQVHVENAPVRRRHGVECDGSPRTRDTARDAVGQAAYLLLAAAAVVLDVDQHGRGLLAREHGVDDELHRPQRLPATPYQQPRILALHVDDGGVVWAASGRADGGARLDIEVAQEVVDDAETAARRRAVALNAACAHLRRFSSDAQYPCASSANDVDGEFAAADAEFGGCQLDRLVQRPPRDHDALVLVLHP